MNTLEEAKKSNENKKEKDKLPFAVFICPKSNVGDTQDYKQVFTDIISDRIQEKYTKGINCCEQFVNGANNKKDLLMTAIFFAKQSFK